MKKILVIVLLLAILAVVGVKGWEHYNQPVLFEDVLPEGPILYLKSMDFAKQLDDLTATKTWANFKMVEFKGLLSLAGFSKTDMGGYEAIVNLLKQSSTHRTVKAGLGREFAIVVYPTQSKINPDARTFQEMGENIFLVTRLPPAARVDQFLRDFFGWIDIQAKSRVTQYKTNKIWHHQLGGQEIAAARFKDVVVLSFGNAAAKSCVEVTQKLKAPLSQDERFLKAKGSFIPGANVQGFIGWESFLAQFKGPALQLLRIQGGKTDQLERKISEAQAFQLVGISGIVGKTIRFKADVYYDQLRLSGDFHRRFDCPAQGNVNLKMIPQDVLGYKWSPCFDLKDTWETSKRATPYVIMPSGEKISVETIVADTEKSLGLSIDQDILPAFGNEFGGGLLDIKDGGNFPKPIFVFFFKIADQAKAQKVVDAVLTQQRAVPQEQENYKNAVIKQVTLPVLADFKPGYLFWDKYLFLSTDGDALRRVVDTAQGTVAGLNSGRFFSEKELNLSEKNNDVFFLQVGPLAKKILELLEQLNRWMKAQEIKQETFRRELFDQVVELRDSSQKQQDAVAKARDEKQQIDRTIKNSPQVDPEAKSALLAQLSKLQTMIQEKQLAIIDASKVAGTDVAGLQAELKLLQEKMDGIQNKISVNDQQESKLSQLIFRQSQLAQKVAAEEKVLQQMQARMGQVNGALARMEKANIMPPAQRDILIADLVRPTLRGLSSCPVFAVKTIFRPGVLETSVFFNFE